MTTVMLIIVILQVLVIVKRSKSIGDSDRDSDGNRKRVSLGGPKVVPGEAGDAELTFYTDAVSYTLNPIPYLLKSVQI